MQITKEDLIRFEEEVIKKYKEGNTYGPVHLSGSINGEQEEALIKIFKNIKKGDWVFTTHRSHYHALLKSKNHRWLMSEIIKKAQSSHINSRKYKIFSSAIVGGIIPIALGTAMALKLQKSKNKVYCFVGDMAAEMGQFWEALKYSCGEKLPIKFIIENNNIGCDTPTKYVWKRNLQNINFNKQEELHDYVIQYEYERKYPHYGIGEWIFFKNKYRGKGDYNANK